MSQPSIRATSQRSCRPQLTHDPRGGAAVDEERSIGGFDTVGREAGLTSDALKSSLIPLEVFAILTILTLSMRSLLDRFILRVHLSTSPLNVTQDDVDTSGTPGVKASRPAACNHHTRSTAPAVKGNNRELQATPSSHGCSGWIGDFAGWHTASRINL